jgi:hypothetical protein
MEYINFFLILLTLLLLSVTSYENFYGCSNPKLQQFSTENGNICCPASSSGKQWEYINKKCCRNKLPESEYNKLSAKLKKKYKLLSDVPRNKLSDVYCAETKEAF